MPGVDLTPGTYLGIPYGGTTGQAVPSERFGYLPLAPGGCSLPHAGAYTGDAFAAQAQGTAWAIPLPGVVGASVASVSVQVTTAGTNTIRLGVYGSDPDGKPTGAPLLQGTVASSSTGVKTLTGPFTCPSKWLYCFVCATGASDTFKLSGLNNNTTLGWGYYVEGLGLNNYAISWIIGTVGSPTNCATSYPSSPTFNKGNVNTWFWQPGWMLVYT